MLLNELCPDHIWIWRGAISLLFHGVVSYSPINEAQLVSAAREDAAAFLVHVKREGSYALHKGLENEVGNDPGSYVLWIFLSHVFQAHAGAVFTDFIAQERHLTARLSPAGCQRTGIRARVVTFERGSKHLLTLVGCNESLGRAGGTDFHKAFYKSHIDQLIHSPTFT